MQNEPEWLTFAEVVELNALVVEHTGEPHGCYQAIVAATLDRCRMHYEYGGTDDVVELACILLMAFARSQGFRQGNKRTGFLAAQMFLELNGYWLDMPDQTWIADMIVDAINDHSFEPTVRTCIRTRVKRI